ncbi:type II toxin-antitoxin system Phd/YefM family antitoxin [Vaginisenegalia massiliensis]|uniref:type II toxin-antitoxin system Phd/YefM family antitoxin n=1 Tax=Vaginisenegalia massiliensis TaxID=2058294 RepID=UPI000F52CA46|nr:type II toxin-antitoxin system Phd/YefM family antitoxin [Vaginisenegalia massiliensis]
MEEIVNPTKFRQNLFDVLKHVNDSHKEVKIIGSNPNTNAVLISLDDWNAIQETLYLERTGTMSFVRERENDNSELIEIDNIDNLDWNNLEEEL